MKNFGNWQKMTRKWGLPIAAVGTSLIWLFLVASTWVDASELSPNLAPDDGASSAPSEDEYNFNWLDPEKKIYVLQNRKYTKANRLLLSVMGGSGFSNAYKTSFNIDPRLAYYVSEAFGIEVFYNFTMNTDNSTLEALQRAAPSTLPVIREIRSQAGAMLQWVPWYAKINVFNQILYFDWYFNGGAGVVNAALDTRTATSSPSNFVNESFLAGFLGTGHHYHLSQQFSVRVDFSAAFYRAPVFGTTGDSSWFSNLNFGIGLGLKI